MKIGKFKVFKRQIELVLSQRALKIPVIAVLGPRQSGKTTLVKAVFTKHKYVSLENYDEREIALQDPRGFLAKCDNGYGMILDEIQHAPKLLSYIQTLVDEQPRPGYIVITGSQNILVNQAITQSLAGRVTILTLMPLSITEFKLNQILPASLEELTVKGGYPRIYAHNLDYHNWYLDYVESYVERDVRQIGEIINLNAFKRFIRLCAGRTGQLLNIAALAVDCGIDQRTAKHWLSILEASYIIFLLQPHHKNFNKRLIKTPKLYFYDTGLACALLDIETASQLDTHYLRGGLVKCLIITEILKHYYNIGDRPNHVYFWRNQSGNEMNCVLEKHGQLIPIEIKAGQTLGSDSCKGLDYWNKLTESVEPNGYLIYGGIEDMQLSKCTIVTWRNIDKIFV